MGGGFNIVNVMLIVVGAILIYSGVKGKKPLDTLRDATKQRAY